MLRPIHVTNRSTLMCLALWVLSLHFLYPAIQQLPLHTIVTTLQPVLHSTTVQIVSLYHGHEPINLLHACIYNICMLQVKLCIRLIRCIYLQLYRLSRRIHGLATHSWSISGIICLLMVYATYGGLCIYYFRYSNFTH